MPGGDSPSNDAAEHTSSTPTKAVSALGVQKVARALKRSAMLGKLLHAVELRMSESVVKQKVCFILLSPSSHINALQKSWRDLGKREPVAAVVADDVGFAENPPSRFCAADGSLDRVIRREVPALGSELNGLRVLKGAIEILGR